MRRSTRPGIQQSQLNLLKLSPTSVHVNTPTGLPSEALDFSPPWDSAGGHRQDGNLESRSATISEHEEEGAVTGSGPAPPGALQGKGDQDSDAQSQAKTPWPVTQVMELSVVHKELEADVQQMPCWGLGSGRKGVLLLQPLARATSLSFCITEGSRLRHVENVDCSPCLRIETAWTFSLLSRTSD